MACHAIPGNSDDLRLTHHFACTLTILSPPHHRSRGIPPNARQLNLLSAPGKLWSVHNGIITLASQSEIVACLCQLCRSACLGPIVGLLALATRYNYPRTLYCRGRRTTGEAYSHIFLRHLPRQVLCLPHRDRKQLMPRWARWRLLRHHGITASLGVSSRSAIASLSASP